MITFDEGVQSPRNLRALGRDYCVMHNVILVSCVQIQFLFSVDFEIESYVYIQPSLS